MWFGVRTQQVAAAVGVALALLGTVSCASATAEPAKARTAADSRECAPRPAATNYGPSALPVSSAQGPGYYGARYAWAVSNTRSGDAGGSGQGAWLELASTDLQLGLTQDFATATPREKQAYRMAIRELRQMASLPDTDVTPQQSAEYNADVVYLNRFFGTKVPA